MQDIQQTLQARHSTYGSFHENAQIAQALKDCVHHRNPSVCYGPGVNFAWAKMDATMREGLEQILSKISRICSPDGDPFYIDNWHDIVGYATLVEKYLREKAGPKSKDKPID